MDPSKKQRQLGQLPLITENDNKKIYFCQRCLNHGSRLPRKNHKCECPYADCKCEFCFLVEKRRQLNSQLHDLEGVDTDSSKGATGDEETVTSNGDGEADRMIRVKGGESLVSTGCLCRTA
ncbi:DM DNA binding domain protein [Oesophagostomum dentatum]|uniref:DM DNA binding domain protein n=1 Tax=Oesophagostomum dentatum TaxID=61180 RepID=A0A0B1S636_OESDE|nr:DM DNA binding domain protein [Oesophagostomum dentatum]KHJ89385.1 DM DNA binding domain protein [Oesophagostomum dentatum]